MRKCYYCGSDVPDNAKFCPKCGKTIEITQNLIDQAKGNDPDAQTELYERTYRLVYSRIRAKVPDDDTAVDIMQETYLRAFTSLDQLQNAETFPSWLLTIANRQTCDWYRKNEKENENVQMSQMEYVNDDTISNEDDLLEEYEYREDFSPEESLDREETGRLLSEILDTLPEDQRIILTMRYYDEMSLQEISDELGVNLSTVKSRLTAGKKKVEAKVLELEKSGTKLYSLGPIAFLVFLLHHAELFAPTISANSVIGLAAVGAGTGGTVAAHVTAGAAVKTAVAAAAKGVSVKVIAVIAAAVVVAGGGITTAVILSNSSNTADANVTETPSSVETEQTTETSKASDTDELEIDNSPSEETVMEIADTLSYWVANSSFGTDRLDFDFNMACELSAIMTNENDWELCTDMGWTDDGYLHKLPEDCLNQWLNNLFGSEYQSSNYNNTDLKYMISSVYPDYNTGLSGYLVRDDSGDFLWYYTGWMDSLSYAEPEKVINISPVDGSDSGDKVCTATVRYDWFYYFNPDGTAMANREDYILAGYADVTFWLKYDEGSSYNWVVTAVQKGTYEESEEYREYLKSLQEPESPSEEVVHAMVDPYAHWFIWTSDAEGKVITPTLNQAAELAACAYFWESNDSWGDFEVDTNGPINFSYILPESGIEESLRNRFGLKFDLSDFTNTISPDATNDLGVVSALSPANNFLEMTLCKVNGQYEYTMVITDGLPMAGDVTITSIDKSDTDEGRFVAAVSYGWYYDSVSDYIEATDEYIYTRVEGVREIEYKLGPDESSGYGWAIEQITCHEGYETNQYVE